MFPTIRWFNQNVRAHTQVHAEGKLTSDCFWENGWKGALEIVQGVTEGIPLFLNYTSITKYLKSV